MIEHVTPKVRSRRFVLPACALVAVVVMTAGCGDGGPSQAQQAAAAAREAREAEDVRIREENRARAEAARLEALWRYQSATVGGAPQVTAAILSTGNVDTDGQGENPVQLVFRDHAEWGRSSYLVLQAGDFRCRPRCTVTVTADDGEPATMAARRPDTDDAIAMFIDDSAVLWRVTAGATEIRVEFPVVAGGTRTARFEVAALDESKMPGWSGGTE